jgi:peptidase E
MIAMKRKLVLANLENNYDILLFSDFLKSQITWLLSGQKISEVLLIPYAYDGQYYNSFIQDIKQLFTFFKMNVKLITEGSPDTLIKEASFIATGGGDLTKLLGGVVNHLGLLKTKLTTGIPYLGWNEGSVVVSPTYIVPAVIPVSPNCIGAISFQIYSHYVDTSINRQEIKNFLLNHKNDTPPITKVYCMTDGPGGSGIRLEDDNEGLVYGPGTSPASTIVFALSGGNLVTT